MVALEDHIQVVVVLDVLDAVREYTFISVEIKSVSLGSIHIVKFYLFGLSHHRHLLPCFPLPPHFMC